jgi:predicted RecA/RadA family phage recombinase
MAQGFLHTGFRAQVITASGAILKNAIIVQEGITGVAQTAIASGAAGWMGVEGVWNLPSPTGTVKGDALYVAAGDSNNASLTKTRGTNLLFGVAETARDANGYAHVRLAQSTHQVQQFTPVASPTATAAAIISSLESAGIFTG